MEKSIKNNDIKYSIPSPKTNIFKFVTNTSALTTRRNRLAKCICIKAASHDGQKLVITTSKRPRT